MRVSAILATLLAASVAVRPTGAWTQAAPATVPALLAAAGTYLDRYEQQFSALVAEEQYAQTTKGPTRNLTQPSRRDLESDLMVLNVSNSAWVSYRDVYTVDHQPVREHDARLQELFAAPGGDALKAAQRIADESAHYNVGVSRNINVPTMALTYLARRNQARSAFALDGTDKLEGNRVDIVKFHETAVPPLINAPGGQVATSGRFWIDPTSGAVRRTELICVVPRPWDLNGTITVDYAQVPAVPIMVPVSMDEAYKRSSGEVDAGHATYSHFRMFAVDTRILKGGG